MRRRDRDEVEELTGQTWVPVLLIGDEIIHESHRICEHVEWLGERDGDTAAEAEAA